MSHLARVSKKRKFVADGVFYAELNELLSRLLSDDGYAGVEVRVTPTTTQIIIRATRSKNVVGEKAQRIKELTSVIQKRFGFRENGVELYAENVKFRGLCAMAQAESLKFKLLEGMAVRRACYGVLRFAMESGAKGCEVMVSGKVRSQRAKGMKFRDGYMIQSGNPTTMFKDCAIKHVLMKAGCVGIRVQIMLPHDPKGEKGPKTPQPDVIKVLDPKDKNVEPDFNLKPEVRLAEPPKAAAPAPVAAAPVTEVAVAAQ